MKNEQNELTPSILLAGKLASAAKFFTSDHFKSMLKELEMALENYDAEMLSLSNQAHEKEQEQTTIPLFQYNVVIDNNKRACDHITELHFENRRLNDELSICQNKLSIMKNRINAFLDY